MSGVEPLTVCDLRPYPGFTRERRAPTETDHVLCENCAPHCSAMSCIGRRDLNGKSRIIDFRRTPTFAFNNSRYNQCMLSESSHVCVRRARVSDAPALSGIYRDSWRATYRGVIPHHHLELMIRRRGTAYWRTSIRAGEIVLLLEFKDKLVGYATCGVARSRGPMKGEIYEIYLVPEYQGVGMGEYLFEACRNHLDARRLDGLLVWVLAENERAIDFYWRRGGRPLTSGYDRIGGVRLEKVAFAWQ